MTNVIFLCTGNAARSVMATVIARDRAPWLTPRGAGTFSIEGLPMSERTRNALRGLGLADREHRSHQLVADDAAWADVIVAFEPQHISYVRKHFPDAAGFTATVPRLLRFLADDIARPLPERLAHLDLATVPIEPWEEVVDPAGGDQDVFDECLAEISGLLDDLLPRLRS
ncbi:MAG: hypothetical protein AAF480_06050 [Actinomycetota bacterium]